MIQCHGMLLLVNHTVDIKFEEGSLGFIYWFVSIYKNLMFMAWSMVLSASRTYISLFLFG